MSDRAHDKGEADGVSVPYNANGFMFAADVWLVLIRALRDKQRSVTRFVLDPLGGNDAPSIEFELRVTRVDSLLVPRIAGRRAKR